MKYRLTILFFLFFGLSQAQNRNVDKQLLWEISKVGTKEKSYLFGTLQSNDKRIFELADSVYTVLDKAKLIILESAMFNFFKDLDSRKKITSTLYDKNGKPYTSSDKASKTVFGDEDGMPQFLDAYFEEYCSNSNKRCLGLEEINGKLSYINQKSFTKQILLNNKLNNFSNQKLLDLYLKGDITSISRFIKSNLSADNKQFEELITNRNIKMADKLDSLFKEKESFFCAIGAGHLAGEEGVIYLLRSKGYSLRPIYWMKSEIKTKERQKIESYNSYLFKDSISGLVANFHGKPLKEINKDGSYRLTYREYGQGNTYIIDVIPNDTSLSFDQIATIYIASPPGTSFKKKILDDGTILCEGISDTYPEGLNWIRIIFNENYFAVLKTYGGNKFMHSDRPKKFFNDVWFEWKI